MNAFSVTVFFPLFNSFLVLLSLFAAVMLWILRNWASPECTVFLKVKESDFSMFMK